MSLENKLTYLDGTKEAIKQAIIDKGVSVTEADTFRSYATKIGEIQSGGTSNKYTGHADVEGLKAIGWTDEDIQYYQENGVNWNEEYDEYHKVPQENIDLYGVLNENNIQTYKDLIVYLPKIEITKTDCSDLFMNCSSLISIPMLDTSNVTDMGLLTFFPTTKKGMFYGCSSLVTIPQLNTSNVTKMSYMFYGCSSLVTIPQLNTSNVTKISNMFQGCSSLVTIPQLNTSNVTDMNDMFYGCSSLVSISLNDISKVTKIGASFTICNLLNNLKINKLNISISAFQSSFISKESLLYIIQNAAPTSAITISLKANVYNKYIEDPDIVSALETQPNITLFK